MSIGYRRLVKGYFDTGARWTAAPKPSLSDALYNDNFIPEGRTFDPERDAALTELEPCFDAACFTRFGRDIFWQPDLVSNELGKAWLARHLGPECRIHRVRFQDRFPERIDATLVPLRPGLVLTNPAHPCLDDTMSLFTENRWESVPAVPSARPFSAAMNVSHWIYMNIHSLDERTVVVEAEEAPMIRLLVFGLPRPALPFRRRVQVRGQLPLLHGGYPKTWRAPIVLPEPREGHPGLSMTR